ncbi:MAG: flagellin [Proteobacteria bacterium]|nr:flagellin [Pseudomonadota bacterium]
MISINTNTAATAAAYNLGNTNVNLQRSLNRLSSGSRINSSMDDAGGLAVSMKLSASIRRTEATQANVNNALSYLETQDGVLKTAEKVVSRMSELIQLAADVTKSTTDTALYKTEYQSLQSQIGSMLGEQFNGINLFTSGSVDTTIDTASLAVVTSQDGNQSINISQLDLGAVGGYVGTASSDNTGKVIEPDSVFTSATGAAAAISNITLAIQTLATLRATNGSEQVRLTFAADMLAINKTNLEAANGRITDVDIASESANLARLNILQQAGTAMLAQANQANQSVLRLLV